MNSELKRCPFCGAQARVRGGENVGGYGPFYYVECCRCWATQKGDDTIKKVVETWNRRAYEQVLRNDKTNATRRGFQHIKAAVQSWDGSIITRLTYKGADLMIEVQYSDTSETTGESLFYGTVADFVKLLKGAGNEST